MVKEINFVSDPWNWDSDYDVLSIKDRFLRFGWSICWAFGALNQVADLVAKLSFSSNSCFGFPLLANRLFLESFELFCFVAELVYDLY